MNGQNGVAGLDADFGPLNGTEDSDFEMLLKRGSGQVLMERIVQGIGRQRLPCPAGAVTMNAAGAIIYRAPIAYATSVPPRVLYDIIREGASEDDRLLAKNVLEIAVSEIPSGLAAHLRRLAGELDAVGAEPEERRIIVPGGRVS